MSNIDRIAKDAARNKKKNKVREYEVSDAYGLRPVWEGVSNTDPDFSNKYSAALNWANAVLESDELADEVIIYLTSIDHKEVDVFKQIPHWKLAHIGKICWLINSGCPVKEETLNFLSGKLLQIRKDFSDYVEEVEIDETAEVIDFPKRNIKEVRRQILKEKLISEIDNMLDLAVIAETNIDDSAVYGMANAEKEDIKLFDELYKHYSQRSIMLIAEIESLDTENLQDIESFDDVETLQRYINDLESHVNNINSVLSQVASYSGNQKALRKSFKRKSKMKSAENQIKNLKFKVQDSKYQLSSIPSVSVIGAQTLAVFNTKNRKLGIYIAKDETGLSIKGTTIQNFDEERSVQKTLKDPKILKDIQSGLIRRAFTLFTGQMRTKGALLNGRLNEHIILVRAYKDAFPQS